MNFRQRLTKVIYPVIMKLSQKGSFGLISTASDNAKPAPETLQFQLNNGQELSLGELRGKKTLIVNTASNCGFTAQYEQLQQLADRFGPKLNIIGVPSNDFKEQEKGNDAEINQFCTLNFGVKFPLSKKSVVVVGKDQHPVFRWLSDPQQNGWNDKAPVWNFSKFLLNEKGELEAVYGPAVSPLDPEITSRLETKAP